MYHHKNNVSNVMLILYFFDPLSILNNLQCILFVLSNNMFYINEVCMDFYFKYFDNLVYCFCFLFGLVYGFLCYAIKTNNLMRCTL